VVGRVVHGQMAGEAIVGAPPLDLFLHKIDELLKQ